MIHRSCARQLIGRVAALAWVAALCLYAAHAGAATGTTRQGGNWNDPNTWSLSRTGTITVASTSTSVTGVGTLFTT
jgi:hypothetical protein